MKLPLDCDVEYHADFVSKTEAAAIFRWICGNCDGLDSNEILLADGSIHRLDTGKIMFVDSELTDFSLFPEPHGRRIEWPSLVAALRDRIEDFTGREFSVCVCIFYRDGGVGVDFHSDFRAFGPVSFIPSISLGAEREFLLRRRDDHFEERRLRLANGSMVIMGEGCQERYEHSLPLDPDCREPRINLTFRSFSWPPGHPRGERR